MKMVPQAILQMYKSGEILETFYDHHDFPIDSDLNGILYQLNSTANNMTRSTVLYYPSILLNKRETIKKANDTKNEDQDKLLIDAKRLLVVNEECESKFFGLLGGEQGVYNSYIAENLNIDTLHKCSASLLTASIKVRVLKDLTENYVMPNKRKPIHIREGVTDKKTKGPLMLALT